MPLQKKSHAVSPLLISLMVLNVAGVFLLFIKAELDVQQIRNEIGIVRRSGEVANLTEAEVSRGISGDIEGVVAGDHSMSRIVATGIGFVVRTNALCRGQYTLTNERRLADPQTGEYVGLVTDVLIGGSPAGQILSQTSEQYARVSSRLPKLAFADDRLAVTYNFKDLSLFDLPGCSVAVTKAP